MQQPFNDESPHRGPLADLVSQIVDVDAQMRALGAHRATLLARAYELADREGLRVVGVDPESVEEQLAGQALTAGAAKPVGLPRGGVVRRERAHRVVRAEIAAALHLPEAHISRDMTHAVDALERCPRLHQAQAEGTLTAQHVHVVVDAGRIIGQHATKNLGGTLVDAAGALLEGDAAAEEIARRYALYEAAVLPYALTYTPPLLVPVAKRLAEKVAGVSFDDRHRVARRERRVWLTELEDGMCNVTAHVTSLEAHAVFDQLTQYGKRLQQADVQASGVQQGSRAGQSSRAKQEPGQFQEGLLGEAAAEVMKRPLPEARADSFVALLLEGEVPDMEGVRTRLGPRVSARVQVLVPVSLTGRLDTATTGTGADTSTSTASGVGAGTDSSTDTASGTGTGTDASTDFSTATASDSASGVGGGVVSGIDDGWFQPELVGVGPIDTGTAQRVAHDTPTWDIVVVDDDASSTSSTDSSETTDTTDITDTTDTPGSSSGSRAGSSGSADTSGITGSISRSAGSSGGADTSGGTGGSGDTFGEVLSVEGYRVPAQMRTHLMVRDERCRFPGCALPSHRCDIDHTIAADDGGPTATDNLGFLCRGHHVLKHHGNCLVVQRERGAYEWTFPSGQVYWEPAPSKVTFSTVLGPPDLQQAQRETRERLRRDAPEPGPISTPPPDPPDPPPADSTSPDSASPDSASP